MTAGDTEMVDEFDMYSNAIWTFEHYLNARSSSWRPFGPPDFVLHALRALRPVRRARLRSGRVTHGPVIG